MEQQTLSPKVLRQRKMLLVMPLLVLPFLTLIFWAFGGGKVSDANAQKKNNGFNMELPNANLKDGKPLDKLNYYDQATTDSAKLLERMKNDPYYTQQLDTSLSFTGTSLIQSKHWNKYVSGKSKSYATSHSSDPNEEKVYSKLAQLDAALNKQTGNATVPPATPPISSSSAVNNVDVDRLEQMMHTMNAKGDDDPEMKQLNGMLEKVLEIQHPEKVEEKIRQESEQNKGRVFVVTSNQHQDSISLLEQNRLSSAQTTDGTSNGFYSIESGTSENEATHAVEAVIHETQTLVNGATVKLRLTDDIYVQGKLIPKGNFVFGTASLNGERLTIKISSIRYESELFPVALSVYDMDGMAGINIPGAIARDVAKNSADRAVQDLNFSTMSTSIGVQAASAGMEAAKSLFSKKVKLIKVTIKAGYQVLLKDEKQQ